MRAGGAQIFACLRGVCRAGGLLGSADGVVARGLAAAGPGSPAGADGVDGGRGSAVDRVPRARASAEAILARVSTQSEENTSESPWAALARDCPIAPAVLVMAAMRELVKVPSFPPQIDLVDGLPKLREIYRQTRLQARTRSI